MNEAFKIKWLWCFTKENTLWRNMIIGEHRVDSLAWCTKKSPFAHVVIHRKYIVVGFETFKSSLHFEVKNGSRARFWHEVWCKNQPLKIRFPYFFRMAHLKNAAVEDVVS